MKRRSAVLELSRSNRCSRVLPLDEQSMLVELINKRIMEKRRAELVGEVERGTVDDLMNDLEN